MVFSSLRSRNRHSANPNPRLHTSACRDTHTHRQMHTDLHQCKHSGVQTHNSTNSQHSIQNAHWGKDFNNSVWQQEDGVHILVHSHSVQDQQDHQDLKHLQAKTAPSSPHSILRPLSQDLSHNFAPILESNPRAQSESPTLTLSAHSFSTQGLPHPFVPLVIHPGNKRVGNASPELTEPTPLTGSDLITLAGCSVTSPVSQDLFDTCDPIPKKKPRKSSMPVKIEQERAEQGGSDEE